MNGTGDRADGFEIRISGAQSSHPSQDLLVIIYRHLKIDSRHEFTNVASQHVPMLSSAQPISQFT